MHPLDILVFQKSLQLGMSLFGAVPRRLQVQRGRRPTFDELVTKHQNDSVVSFCLFPLPSRGRDWTQSKEGGKNRKTKTRAPQFSLKFSAVLQDLASDQRPRLQDRAGRSCQQSQRYKDLADRYLSSNQRPKLPLGLIIAPIPGLSWLGGPGRLARKK